MPNAIQLYYLLTSHYCKPSNGTTFPGRPAPENRPATCPLLVWLHSVKMLCAGCAIPLVGLLTLWDCRGLRMKILILKYEKNQIPSSGGVDALNDIYYLTDYLAGQPGWVAFVCKPTRIRFTNSSHAIEFFVLQKPTRPDCKIYSNI